MFTTRITLFRLFGIPLRLDLSWFVVAALMLWSLAGGLFPAWYPRLAPRAYWLMGAVGTLGLFASIVIHEFFHAFFARRHLIPMQGITLFIFGGVAEMGGEPRDAKAEFVMAVAGPLASVALAALALGLAWAGAGAGWPTPITGVLTYLGVMNAGLAAFNLVPAFPLDGGRIFRAAVWHWKRDLTRATRIAAKVGTAFSTLLMIVGALRLFAGDLLGGIWSFLIGLFLRQAATTSYQQVLVRRALEGQPVRHFMTREPVTVRPGITLAELLDGYFYRYHHRLFPVEDNGHLLGAISSREMKRVPRAEWQRRTVGATAVPVSPDNTIGPDADALQALAVMNRTGQPRLLVVQDGRLAGIVSLKDLLDFFALRAELE